MQKIASASGLPRPTAHRMLTAMREVGFIDQDRVSGNYSLGIRLFELGSLVSVSLYAVTFELSFGTNGPFIVSLGFANGASRPFAIPFPRRT